MGADFHTQDSLPRPPWLRNSGSGSPPPPPIWKLEAFGLHFSTWVFSMRNQTPSLEKQLIISNYYFKKQLIIISTAFDYFKSWFFNLEKMRPSLSSPDQKKKGVH